jgi:hypothetical protein
MFLVRKLKEKKSLQCPRLSWEGSVELHSKEIGWDDLEWVSLTEDRGRWQAVLDTVMKRVLHKV